VGPERPVAGGGGEAGRGQKMAGGQRALHANVQQGQKVQIGHPSNVLQLELIFHYLQLQVNSIRHLLGT
jgi:hypothetical protein